MTRRNPTTILDSDTEEARIELERIEGHKNAMQTEVLGIAQNKKELVTSFEDAKVRLNSEFEQKKSSFNSEIKMLEDRINVLKVEKSKAEKVGEQANTESQKMLVIKENIKTDIAKLTTEQQQNNSNKVSLVKSINELESQLKQLKSDFDNFSNIKSDLVKEIKEKTDEKSKLAKDILESEGLVSKYTSDINVLVEQHKHALSDSDSSKKSLEEIQPKLSVANAELLDTQKKKVELEQKMQERENDVNKRMGDLTRLEVVVDGKMVQLKELEQHFTTEHLARGGYKKLIPEETK